MDAHGARATVCTSTRRRRKMMFGRCRSCRKFRVLHSRHIIEDTSGMDLYPPSVKVYLLLNVCGKCVNEMTRKKIEEWKRGHN